MCEDDRICIKTHSNRLHYFKTLYAGKENISKKVFIWILKLQKVLNTTYSLKQDSYDI